MTTISKKVCLLGDFAVGKTSLVRRFVYSLFDDTYISTIGVKVSRKTVILPHQEQTAELTMMLWDLAGSEEFDRMRLSYLRGAAGALLVCDLTRPETLDGLPGYADALSSVTSGAWFVVVANKRDLNQISKVTEPQVKVAADRLYAPYYLTSAKTGEGVEEAFRHLGQLMLG